MEFYVDGRLVDSDRYEGGLDQAAGGQNYVGRSNWPGDALFQGYVAEFRVWDRRRTREEILSRMGRLLTGREPGLAGYWRFNRAEGASVPDDGPSGRSASLMGGAQVVTVPAVARYLTPGELEKAAANVYALGQTSLKQGAYITAYKDFQAALDLVPGFRDADALMREAVEKGRYRLAVFPVAARMRVGGSGQTSRPGLLRRALEALSESGTVDLLRQEEARAALEEDLNETLLSELSKGLPPYVDLVAQNRLDWILKGKGLDVRRADPAQIVQAAGGSGIRAVALGEVDVASLTQDSDREAQKAFLAREVSYFDDKGKEKKRREKAGEHTYYVVKKDVRMTCRVSYRVVEAETGEALKQDFVEEEVQDAVEYADPNGMRPQDLWVERYGDLRRLDGEDKRFGAREKLRSRPELISAALGVRMAERLLSFVEGYSPGGSGGK
ncbi:MAG: LamG domain-containing protein [Candidatus Latescibacteria bacterium]|nr:LamG domain-containing protein [Candidatus Latescibacterota bacterium]